MKLKNSNMAAYANMKEVITVQVGNYSNFIGSHFWNLQEALLHNKDVDEGFSEINNNVLYREGQNLSGNKTRKPRVISLDLKENVSRLQECDEVSDSVEGHAWEGTIERYDRGTETSSSLVTGVRECELTSATKPIQADSHKYQNITMNFKELEDVHVSWLDYSLVRFHAKSLQTIQNSHVSECEGFDNFGCGEQLFQNQKFRDDFDDRLHFFSEECDRLQGFQILTDMHNSFGGLTSGILQELDEEFSKKSHLCFATMPAAFAEDTRCAADQRILNIVLELAKFGDLTGLTFPMSLRNSFGLKSTSVALPWIDYKDTLDYHSSAVLATAIDTATLPYRLTNPQATDMRTLTGNISSGGRKIAAMSAAIPVPVSTTFTLKELLQENECSFNNFTSLTPDVTKPGNIFSQATVIRGLPLHLLKKSDYARTAQMVQAGAKHYLGLGSHSSHIAQQPCTLTSLFPDFFKCSVTPVGCVVEDYQRPREKAVHKMSAMTNLQSCEDIGNLLDVLVAGAKKANVKKHPGFLEAGVEQDDIETSLETLNAMRQAYQLRYEL